MIANTNVSPAALEPTEYLCIRDPEEVSGKKKTHSRLQLSELLKITITHLLVQCPPCLALGDNPHLL